MTEFLLWVFVGFFVNFKAGWGKDEKGHPHPTVFILTFLFSPVFFLLVSMYLIFFSDWEESKFQKFK